MSSNIFARATIVAKSGRLLTAEEPAAEGYDR